MQAAAFLPQWVSPATANHGPMHNQQTYALLLLAVLGGVLFCMLLYCLCQLRSLGSLATSEAKVTALAAAAAVLSGLLLLLGSCHMLLVQQAQQTPSYLCKVLCCNGCHQHH
jgi:hypothetical protein